MLTRSRTLVAAFAAGLVLAGCGDDTTSPTPPTSHDLAAPTGGNAGPRDMAMADLSAAAGDDMAAPTAHSTTVRILAVNDFHGHLGPPDVFNGGVLAQAGDPEVGDLGQPFDGGVQLVQAGGAAYIAAHLKQLEAEVPSNIVVSSGDLTGASPLLAQQFHNEPSVLAWNLMGLKLNAVGNHEFDNGLTELDRYQHGGCIAGDPNSCVTDMGFPGASFEYLAANVEFDDGGATIFPPWAIEDVGGVKIAFVGMTLEGTPAIVSAKNVAGLDFLDETATVNALVPKLKAAGAASIVVLVHQGDSPPGNTTYDECNDTSGPVYTMAMNMDPAIDAILSAHTHRAYNCVINGKVVSSAASYGRIITALDLTIDLDANQTTSKVARQHVVTRGTPDPAVNALVNEYVQLTRATADVVEGALDVDLSPSTDGMSGQSAMGDVVADGMLWYGQQHWTGSSTAAPTIALMNAGGIRGGVQAARLYPDSEPPSLANKITYEKLETVQPFADVVDAVTITPAQLKAILLQQWQGQPYTKIMMIAGLRYHYAPNANVNQITITKMEMFTGAPWIDPTTGVAGQTAGGQWITLDPTDTTTPITVVSTTYITDNGDGFTAFGNPPPLTTLAEAIDLPVTAEYLRSVCQVQVNTPPAANVPGRSLPTTVTTGRVFGDGQP